MSVHPPAGTKCADCPCEANIYVGHLPICWHCDAGEQCPHKTNAAAPAQPAREVLMEETPMKSEKKVSRSRIPEHVKAAILASSPDVTHSSLAKQYSLFNGSGAGESYFRHFQRGDHGDRAAGRLSTHPGERMTLAEETVLAKYPDAHIVIDETREKTKLFCVRDGLSVWRFSEEDAWADAYRRLQESCSQNVNYLAEPFRPWWNVEELGLGPQCEVCGAQMVRTCHDNIDGRQPGWECRSCDNYHQDAADEDGGVE